MLQTRYSRSGSRHAYNLRFFGCAMELLLFLAGLVGRHPPCSQDNCRCLSGPEEIELTLLYVGERRQKLLKRSAGNVFPVYVHKVAFLLSFGVFPLQNGTVTCINKLLIFMRGI